MLIPLTLHCLGMEKEVENLISENNELLATKNALNIVKDDLINKVDALESELTMSRNENQQLTAVKNCLKTKNSQLDEENKRLKEIIEELKAKMKEDDEEGEGRMTLVDPKTFPCVKMARLLTEPNPYIYLFSIFCPFTVLLISFLWFLPLTDSSGCFLLRSGFLSRNDAFRPPI